MSARQRVLQELADLSDEDVDALLPIVERLRAKHLAPVPPPRANPAASATSATQPHPERFGSMAGTARVVGDIEEPIERVEAWTYDEQNLKS